MPSVSDVFTSKKVESGLVHEAKAVSISMLAVSSFSGDKNRGVCRRHCRFLSGLCLSPESFPRSPRGVWTAWRPLPVPLFLPAEFFKCWTNGSPALLDVVHIDSRIRFSSLISKRGGIVPFEFVRPAIPEILAGAIDGARGGGEEEDGEEVATTPSSFCLTASLKLSTTH